MKDNVLYVGSDEYQIEYYRIPVELLDTCLPKERLFIPLCQVSLCRNLDAKTQSRSPSIPSEGGIFNHKDMINMAPAKNYQQNRLPMDDGLTLHNSQTGHTDRHLIQVSIDKVTKLHNRIDKTRTGKKHEQLIQASQQYIKHTRI